MDISLTPKELRDLLVPPMLKLRGPREPLDLDALMRDGAILRPFTEAERLERDEDPDDRDGLSAQRALVVTLADLAQAQEELARTKVLVEEKAEELRQLIENYGKVRQTPVMRAQAVIDNAGAQVLDLARIFFLETGGPLWYQGIRATMANLVSILGVEVEDEKLEEHLKPTEVEPPAAAPATSAELGVPVHPGLNFGGRRSTLGADSEDLVPPAGPFESPNVVIEPKGDAAGPRESQCKHCGEEIRLVDLVWIDAETHSTCINIAPAQLHEPAEDAAGDDIEF